MDFANRRIITDDELHATIAGVSLADRLASFFQKFDASINQQILASALPGAAADSPFNLDACFKMVPANAEGEGR